MKSTLLLVFPLLIISLVGIVYNEAQASNLAPASPIYSCNAIFGCTIGTYVPVANQWSANTFAFMNPNSPFTYLLQGRIVDFLFFGFNQPASYNFGSYLSGNVGACVTTATGYYCQNIFTSSAPGQCQTPPFGVPLNYTNTQGNATIWTIYATPFNVVNCQYQSASGTKYSYVTSAYCTIHPNRNPQFIFCTPPSSYSATNTFTGIFGFFAFVIGIILLILGLGIGFSFSALASGVSFQTNQQGTKMAQTFGIYLILFGFITAQFANAFFLIPYSIGTLVYIILTLVSIIGLYWRIQSYD
jgi:hypothetical protein